MNALNVQPNLNYSSFFITKSSKIIAAGAVTSDFLFQIGPLPRLR